MKSVFISLAILLSSSLSLATVDVNPTQYLVHTGIYINGKLISNPRLAILEGEESTITQGFDTSEDRLVLKVTAKNAKIKNKPAAIMVSLNLFYKKGDQEFQSTPQIVLMEGKTGMIETTEKNGPTVSMEVSAERMN